VLNIQFPVPNIQSIHRLYSHPKIVTVFKDEFPKVSADLQTTLAAGACLAEDGDWNSN
jgi:hypothetical protein